MKKRPKVIVLLQASKSNILCNPPLLMVTRFDCGESESGSFGIPISLDHPSHIIAESSATIPWQMHLASHRWLSEVCICCVACILTRLRRPNPVISAQICSC